MRYAAFFRGINVGGRNIVKMASLKQLFEELGFDNVKTYIQSGNVVFDSPALQAEAAAEIRAGFADAFGFESAVILRTRDELSAIIEALPFSSNEIAEAEKANSSVEHLYVYMPDKAPLPELAAKLEGLPQEPDKLRLVKNEIYLLCQNSVRDSKAATLLAKLKIPMTSRNWNTLCKLQSLANE